jgi:histidinol-phosphate/aromatic aminotransferase/cobyric acid decarboxylase-like protein/imidazoleglycerol phosphate dehydratase HisB
MRPLGFALEPYRWAPSTEAVASLAGIDPVEVLRFDGNVPAAPHPTARPAAIAATLADINTYPHGGYRELIPALAAYAGVDPSNVVLGAGCDDLIMLTARAFAGPGHVVAIANEPTYPLYRIAAAGAGARLGETAGAAVTFCCRPNNPSGALEDLPRARPLVVDEAYFEYAGVTAADLIEDDVVVLRTFSKAFGLAGARVGYALARAEVAADLNLRQSPAPLSTPSAQLAVAALAAPPDVRPQIEERARLAGALRALGLRPWPSHTNFLYVPHDDGPALAERLMRSGIVVRAVPGGIRASVRDATDDDVLVGALARALEGSEGRPDDGRRRARVARATTETRMSVRLDLDGERRVVVRTGAGLYDHLVEQLAFHAGLDLLVEGVGDVETGVHHTAEDLALAVGEALGRALGDRSGIARYGEATVPMDEAQGRALVDLGGRPFAKLAIDPDPGLAAHVLASLAQAGRLDLHVEATGRDPHHTAEAAFKAAGRALAAALAPGGLGVASTKGAM